MIDPTIFHETPTMFCVYNKPTPTFNSSFDLISLIESMAMALDQDAQLDCDEKCSERLEGLARNSGDHGVAAVDKSPPTDLPKTIPKPTKSESEPAESKQPVDFKSDYFSGLTVKEDKSKFYIKFIDKDISEKTLNVEYFDENYLTIEVIESVDGYSYKHTSTINFNSPVNSNGIYAQMNKDGRVSIKVPKKSIKVKIHQQVEKEQQHNSEIEPEKVVENGPGGNNQELPQPAIIEPNLNVEEANLESAKFQEPQSYDSENPTNELPSQQLDQPIESFDAGTVEEESSAAIVDTLEQGSTDTIVETFEHDSADGEVDVVDELTMTESNASDTPEVDEPFENINAEDAQNDSQAESPTNTATSTQTVAVDKSAMQKDDETALQPSSID